MAECTGQRRSSWSSTFTSISGKAYYNKIRASRTGPRK